MESTVKIVKGDGVVPRRQRRDLYPWQQMEVGDYFVYPSDNGAAASAVHFQNKRSDRKYTSRKIDGEVRIYRSQ